MPYLLGAASQAVRLSAVGAVRSQSPLRGSPGFAPDSRLSLDVVLDTADKHKIFPCAARVKSFEHFDVYDADDARGVRVASAV